MTHSPLVNSLPAPLTYRPLTYRPPTSSSSASPQVTHSPYSGVLDCVKQVLKKDGAGAFFKSYQTTLVSERQLSYLYYEAPV